jgi:hypothetical protein
MDNFTKTMAGTAVGLGSIALVGHSMKMIPKDMMQVPRPQRMRMRIQGRPVRMQPMKMKPVKFNTRASTGNFVKGAAGLMVGTALLSGASSMIK